MDSIATVSEQEFEAEVLTSPLPVLVEFGAEWCGPCKTVAPELAALSSELAGKAKVVQIDVDSSPRIAQAMRIQSVPTFIVFVGGRPVDAGQGAMKKAQLRALLEKHLPKAAGAINAGELAKLLETQSVTPVDIRPENVFKRASLAGALSFPADDLVERATELQDVSPPAVLYCRDGKQAQTFAATLASQGTPVAFLEGGVLSWEAEGYRLTRHQ